MLSFLRNNSIKIVYGIIISFIVTTFLGVIYFNDSFKMSRDSQKMQMDRQNAIAVIGDIPVTQQVYQLELQRIQATLPSDLKINNNIAEAIQLNALNRAIENSLLLEIGKKQKVKVSRSEINASLLSVMDQFQVASKKDLKETLKNAGGSYDAMLNQLKNDLIALKTRQAIESSVQVTENDMQNVNSIYEIRDLFISNLTTANTKIDDEELFQKAQQIRQSITDSDTFSKAFIETYPELGKPSSVKVTINQLSPDLARALVVLSSNEISQPIKTMNGYHIIELLDVKSGDKVITLDELKAEWSRIVLFEYLTAAKEGREVKILNLNLRAIKLKSEGRFDEAINAYQGLISKDPSNPYPNLYIAQLQFAKGDTLSAKQSLLKGEIKQSLLSEKIIVPEIHLFLAEIYNREKFNEKRDEQYDKLLNSDSPVEVLTFLKDRFSENNDDTRLVKVTQLIDEKSATSSAIIESLETSDSDDEFLSIELN